MTMRKKLVQAATDAAEHGGGQMRGFALLTFLSDGTFTFAAEAVDPASLVGVMDAAGGLMLANEPDDEDDEIGPTAGAC
jgi:hypothetical protein